MEAGVPPGMFMVLVEGGICLADSRVVVFGSSEGAELGSTLQGMRTLGTAGRSQPRMKCSGWVEGCPEWVNEEEIGNEEQLLSTSGREKRGRRRKKDKSFGSLWASQFL